MRLHIDSVTVRFPRQCSTWALASIALYLILPIFIGGRYLIIHSPQQPKLHPSPPVLAVSNVVLEFAAIGPASLSGALRNTSSVTAYHVRSRVSFYGPDQQIIGNALVTAPCLHPGQAVAFEASVKTLNVKSAKVDSLAYEWRAPGGRSGLIDPAR